MSRCQGMRSTTQHRSENNGNKKAEKHNIRKSAKLKKIEQGPALPGMSGSSRAATSPQVDVVAEDAKRRGKRMLRQASSPPSYTP